MFTGITWCSLYSLPELYSRGKIIFGCTGRIPTLPRGECPGRCIRWEYNVRPGILIRWTGIPIRLVKGNVLGMPARENDGHPDILISWSLYKKTRNKINYLSPPSHHGVGSPGGARMWEIVFGIVGIIAVCLWASVATPSKNQKVFDSVRYYQRRDVEWAFESYRIEALRMQWASMDPVARQWYLDHYGFPKWAKKSRLMVATDSWFPPNQDYYRNGSYKNTEFYRFGSYNNPPFIFI